MKVIVDISEDMFEWFKNGEIVDEYDKSALKQVFQNGTPLDDVKAEIESGSFTDLEGDAYIYVPYAFEILDNIGKESKE